MSDSDTSGLSSAPSVDDDFIVPTRGQDGMLQFLTKARASSPPADDDERPNPRKRASSPPHEYVLADNPDIAVRVIPPLKTGSISRGMIPLTRDMGPLLLGTGLLIRDDASAVHRHVPISLQ
jgi:hypothetical protein